MDTTVDTDTIITEIQDFISDKTQNLDKIDYIDVMGDIAEYCNVAADAMKEEL